MPILFVAAAAAFAAPAAAAEPADPRAREIVRALPAPEEMEATGAVLGAAAEALMDVPVGPLVEKIDPERARELGRSGTLGQLAAGDDPHFRSRLRDEMAAVSAGLGVMTQRFAALAPVLVATLDDVEARLEDALENLPAR